MTRQQAIAADVAWYVRRVRLNSQGYTSSGSYYDVGMPLYECFNAREYVNFRADDRQHAIEQLRDHMRPYEVHVHKS